MSHFSFMHSDSYFINKKEDKASKILKLLWDMNCTPYCWISQVSVYLCDCLDLYNRCYDDFKVFFLLLSLGVATPNHLPPSHPILYILFCNINPLMSSFTTLSVVFLLCCWQQLQHPLSNISTMSPKSCNEKYYVYLCFTSNTVSYLADSCLL